MASIDGFVTRGPKARRQKGRGRNFAAAQATMFPMRSFRGLAVFALLSLVGHVVAVLALPFWARSALAELPAYEVEVEVAVVGTAVGAGERERHVRGEHAELLPGGPESIDNIDSRDRGAGGDPTGASAIILLMPRADGITLADAPMMAAGIGQSQRIATARDRATREDRRATPHPDDQPFLASGAGALRERRPLSATDPSPGARSATPGGTRGEAAPGGATTQAAGEGPLRAQAALTAGAADTRDGAERSSPARGTLESHGARESIRAPVATARPPVDEGPAATLAQTRDARVRDDTDAELLATRPIQSEVEASARRGASAGAGRGGLAALGDPASGGARGSGGSARVHGPGPGAAFALDTSEPRYQRWYLDQQRRVSRALVFPRERMLRMDQGTSLVRVVVRRDGSLATTPRVLRSSGFVDLDRAALAAIEDALPFGPMPDDLAPGRERLSITIPVRFWNPMVGR